MAYMEKLRKHQLNVNITKEDRLFEGLTLKAIISKKWELVYFLSPFCLGTCNHCWSSDTFLGRFVPLSWHQKYWNSINTSNLNEVRITGGEPFLYKNIGEVVSVIRNNLDCKIPINIFTSGREFISLKKGEVGISETVEKIIKAGVVKENVELYLSADEHHAGSLYRSVNHISSIPTLTKEIRKMNKLGLPYLEIQINNFFEACRKISTTTFLKFNEGKLKIHTEKGRLSYHEKYILSKINKKVRRSQIILTEGLTKAGRAKKLKSENIEEKTNSSVFILPGAEFYTRKQSEYGQEYIDIKNKKVVYLDISRINGLGASIIGWNNLINRNFCGGTAYDFFNLFKN